MTNIKSNARKAIAMATLSLLTVSGIHAQGENEATVAKTPHTSQGMVAYPKTHTSVSFKTDAELSEYITPAAPIRWGMDVAWNDGGNVTRGTNYIGKDVLSIGRVSFQPSDLVTDDFQLSAAQQKTLQSRLNNMTISGVKDINLNCDHEVLCNKDNFPNADQNYANYNGKPEEWYKVIKATMLYCKAKGFNVISVSPFNEPDYTAWKEGTQAHFKAIAKLISEDEDFKGVRICAGNTLNCDQALSWYNAVKPYVNEGNTHQLAGSFDTYAKFWETVKTDGNYATADELHNTMEAFVGIHYGMDAGIWWGYDGLCRGEFCRASHYGKEIAYGENRSAWSAAAVYKRPEGRIDAFLGTSERQAYDSSYELISKDRLVYFDGHGPLNSYGIDLPGGTGYQKGQTNAERLVQIQYGEDVPVEPIEKGTYVIMNVATKKVIGYAGGVDANGTQLSIASFSSGTRGLHQQWILEPVPARVGGDFSYYYFKSARHSYEMMDLKNFVKTEGATLIGYAGNGGDQEQWALEYAGKGNWYIRSRHSGLYVDVPSSTPLRMSFKNGSDTQLWRIMPVGAARELDAPIAPSGLSVKSQAGSVMLSWNANAEADLLGYMVLRAKAVDGIADDNTWDVLGRKIEGTEFVDNSAIDGISYVYKVKAIDNSRNISDASEPVVYTPAESAKKGLVARYTFDENCDDETGNVFDLAATSGLVISTSTKHEGAASLYFKTSSDYAMIPSAAVTRKTMTFATWFYSMSASSWQRIFDFGNDTDHYMFLTPSNGSEMRFVVKNGGEEQILSVPKIGLASWHHIAVTIGEDEVAIYVDGEKKAASSDITIRTTDFCPTRCYIGRSQYASDPNLRGYLDDMRIYNYALSADEVKRVMDGEIVDGIKGAHIGGAANGISNRIYTIDGRKSNDKRGIRIVNGKKTLSPLPR